MACLLRCCCLCILHAMLPIKIQGYNFDIVLLAGTGSRRGESIEAFKMQGWQVVSSGFANCKMPNMSCGAAIAVGPRFKSSRQFPPVESSGKLQGRGLSIRVVNSYSDFTPIVAYYAPFLQLRSQHLNYPDTCKALSSWVSAVLDKVPAGSTPVLFCDVNDGIGVKEVGGSLQLLESSVVSELAAGKEKMPGVLRRHVSSQNHSAPQFQVSEERKIWISVGTSTH